MVPAIKKDQRHEQGRCLVKDPLDVCVYDAVQAVESSADKLGCRQPWQLHSCIDANTHHCVMLMAKAIGGAAGGGGSGCIGAPSCRTSRRRRSPACSPSRTARAPPPWRPRCRCAER